MLSARMLFAFVFFVFLHASGQPDQLKRLDGLAGQFVKYIRSKNREKVIVVTDRELYVVGEKIWLKAWTLDSPSNKLTTRSRNLFVDLVDDRDSVISQLLLDNRNKKTNGDMLIPESLDEGYYWLRGYTRNILFEDTNRVFVKPLYVLNRHKPAQLTIPADSGTAIKDAGDTSAPTFFFFPEGGAVVAGTAAAIAFRCLSKDGKQLKISGYVTDTRNNTVSTFTSDSSGMGIIRFNAFNPRKYFIHSTWNNRDRVYPLPPFNQYAAQLSLIDQTDKEFHLRVSLGDSLYKKNTETYLLGISKDSLCFAAHGTDMYDVNVPKDNFPPGKATLFLFNAQDQIVSQRTIFVDSNPTRVTLTTNQAAYGSREKVKLNIKVSSHDQDAAMALFSVVVIDDRLAVEPWDELLVNRASQEKKYTPQEMDLSLLLEKNLYPDWIFANDLNSAERPADKYDSSSLVLKGEVVNKKNEPLKNCIANLFSNDNTLFKIDTTDDQGHFQIPLPDYEDGTQFNLKLTNLKGKEQEGKVIFNKFDFPEFKTPKNLKKYFDRSKLTTIINFKMVQQDTANYPNEKGLLKPVTIRGTKQKPVPYDESKRMSSFSDIITSDNFNKGDRNAIVDAISRVPGFNTGPNTISLGNAGGSYNVLPLLIVDGVTMTPSGGLTNFLQEFEQGVIDFIEILKGPQTAIYGIQGAGGVILINTTNRKKVITRINDQGIATIFPKGYGRPVDFTGPDYDNPSIKASSYPDRRFTIFWNGNVLTDANGKAVRYFFTADTRTNYSIVISGITTSGEYIFEKLKIVKS